MRGKFCESEYLHDHKMGEREKRERKKKKEVEKNVEKTTINMDGLKIYANQLPATFRFISRLQLQNHV